MAQSANGKRPCKVGLFPPLYPDFVRGTPRWSEVLAMAQRAEAVGFDSLWVPDHLIVRFPGSEPQGVWEGWSILSALAAATERVELGTLVLCTGFRNPALLAKMADTVDEISGGRLILGIGAGWHEPEYDAFGFPFDHRYGRFEEAFTIIRTLLREGRVNFAGQYYQARDCELRPRGPRPNGPPILIGTTGEKMLRLTARHADLWNCDWRNRAADLAPLLADVDAACAEVGRDPATLGRTAALMIDLPIAGTAREGQYDESPALTGPPEELAEAIRAHARAGVSHVQVWLNPNTLEGLEAFAPVLELLDRGERRANW